MGRSRKNGSALSFGLWPLGAAARYLGVSTRQLLNYLKSGHVPGKYNDKLLDMGKTVVLPVDEPPAKKALTAMISSMCSAGQRGLKEHQDGAR